VQFLGGRYESLKTLASGGMAVVHLGRAVGVGGFERLVAIKVMHPHIAEDPDFVDMFLDEARLAARIRHPNVVATIDVQEAEEGLFLVMELVDGPSFGRLQKVAAGKALPVPPGVIVRVMVDTLSGLHAAHELTDDEGDPLHLVHRDVTPANILVGADGVARITDFGVAQAEARLSSTRGGQVKGKIPYMPPEQILGETIDRRCDVYSAGVVLWEALVGRRLFRADNDGRMVQMIIQGPQKSPREVRSTTPEALDRVCMRALASSPAERYATAADFVEALEIAAEADGFSIATARAVAAFVERSGAHNKLDVKELAALKRGVSEGAGAAARPALPSSPSSPGSVPSISGPFAPSKPSGEGLAAAPGVSAGDAASGSGRSASGPDRADPALAGAEPDEASSVTAIEASISGAHDLDSAPLGRTGIMVGTIGVVVGAAIAAGWVISSGGDTVPDGSQDDARPAAQASAPMVTDATAVETPSAPSTPSATASASANQASTSPSASTASAEAVTAAPKPGTPPPKVPTPKTKPQVPKPGKPRPGSTSYNPDRL